MQNATTVCPPITPAWTNLAVTSEKINKLDLSCTSPGDHRYDSASPQSDHLTIDEDRLSPISNTSTSSSSSTLPPKKRYMHMMLNKDSNKENDDLDQSIYNSTGKVKKPSCRRCSFAATTKRDYWPNLRTHIRPEKWLECPKCPFVTDYKRHFEHHARNHLDSKPFKCQKCEYSGASKSMLESHLKSHSTMRPFASKFCHRLRRDLDKQGHDEGFMLNEDGSFNLENVILSSRREAAMKKGKISATPVQIELGNGKMIPVVLPTASFYYEPMCAGYTMPSAAVQVVPEVHEEPNEPVNYSQRSTALPSPPNREVGTQRPIDLSDETSAPLDLSKKNDTKGSPVNPDCPVEDNTNDVQQQIQHLRAILNNMHQFLWNVEQSYLYTTLS